MLLDPELSGLPAESRREVVVDALTHEESEELALKLIGHDDQLARYQAAMIARESRGSPYFVYELVQHLSAGGELEDRSTFRGSISLDDVLWARIERLPEGARALLEVLTVAGQPLRQADTIRAAGLGPEGFTALASLRASHLIRGTGSGALDDVETYHDRIRETIVNHLEPERLKAWHECLAVALESSGRGDAQALAVHFDAAGSPEKAGEYYVRARARRRGPWRSTTRRTCSEGHWICGSAAARNRPFAGSWPGRWPTPGDRPRRHASTRWPVRPPERARSRSCGEPWPSSS